MVKCSLEMLLKYFQIRILFVRPVSLTGQQDPCQHISSSNCCFPGWRDWLPIFQSVQTQQLGFQPRDLSFCLIGFFFFSWLTRLAEVLGVFCEIVKGIIIFCLNVFTPQFLQPAESHTIDMFSTEKLRKSDIPGSSQPSTPVSVL